MAMKHEAVLGSFIDEVRPFSSLPPVFYLLPSVFYSLPPVFHHPGRRRDGDEA
jgi:hypothetical protein